MISGWGWCNKCKGNNSFKLKGDVVTCSAGHTRKIKPREDAKSDVKPATQPKEIRVPRHLKND